MKVTIEYDLLYRQELPFLTIVNAGVAHAVSNFPMEIQHMVESVNIQKKPEEPEAILCIKILREYVGAQAEKTTWRTEGKCFVKDVAGTNVEDTAKIVRDKILKLIVGQASCLLSEAINLTGLTSKL